MLWLYCLCYGSSREVIKTPKNLSPSLGVSILALQCAQQWYILMTENLQRHTIIVFYIM